MSMLDCPDDFHRENRSFSALKKTGYRRTDRPIDGPTDRPTDTTSYGVARTHLRKKSKKGVDVLMVRRRRLGFGGKTASTFSEEPGFKPSVGEDLVFRLWRIFRGVLRGSIYGLGL